MDYNPDPNQYGEHPPYFPLRWDIIRKWLATPPGGTCWCEYPDDTRIEHHYDGPCQVIDPEYDYDGCLACDYNEYGGTVYDDHTCGDPAK